MIHNIIFDLGGVLFNLDYDRTIQRFESSGFPEFKSYFSQLQQHHLFNLYESGKISSDEFHDSFRRNYQTRLSDDEIDAAWNVMLIGFPHFILDFLSELKKTYRLFLMSNANEIHIREVNRLFIQQFPGRTFADYFDRMYFSYLTGLRKPDEAFFNKIITDNNLEASETAFFDDSPQHVEAAQKMELRAFLVPKNVLINEFVKKLTTNGEL